MSCYYHFKVIIVGGLNFEMATSHFVSIIEEFMNPTKKLITDEHKRCH